MASLFSFTSRQNRTLSAGPFPDPFMDYASLAMPDSMISALDWCLLPGTPIELADLTTKPIEAMRPGDVVLTRGRTHERVVANMVRQVDEDIFEIVCTGYGKEMPLRITGNHKIWRIPGQPGRRPNKQNISFDAIEQVRVDQLVAGDYLLSPLPVRGQQQTSKYDGWLIGMYLAEGNICRDGDRCTRTRFSCGQDDETTGVLQKLIDELHAASGIEVDCDTPPSRPDARIVNHSDPELPDWLAANCPGLAKTKRLSALAKNWSDETLLALLAGWIDGDGYVNVAPYRGGVRCAGAYAYSTSVVMSYQLMRLANMIGLRPSVCKTSNNRGYSANGDSKCYAIKFGLADCAKLKQYCVKLQLVEQRHGSITPKQESPKTLVVGDKFIARKITGITQRRYVGPVYNIEVENDHSYIASGILVANCEAIISINGIYRAALERVIGFFITEVKISGASPDERERYEDFLNNTLGINAVLRQVALDFLCFHGDTRVPTRNGVFKIRDLVGQTVEVLSRGGVYRKAEFKQFGRQKLMQVTFADGRQVLATPEHEWLVQASSGGLVKVPTTRLAGRRIPRTVASRPEQNEEFREGVRHGFVFGDGSLYNKFAKGRKTMAVANFYGNKDKALLPYFVGCGGSLNEIKNYGDRRNCEHYKIHGLPAYYKELPANTASASYWYGFVCGFLAADGSVDVYGCAILTQKNKATLEAIEAQLPRLGMSAGPIRSQTQTTLLPEYKGKRKPHTLTMHYMTLLKQFMQAADFIIPRHRANFEANNNSTNYGKFIGVESVVATDIEDDVYCCVEPETHSFVIENGVLTGNCYGNSMTSLIVPFDRYLRCDGCGFDAPLTVIANNPRFKYKWSGLRFHAVCPYCSYSGTWTHVDRRSGNESQIHVKRWNPKELELLFDPYSHHSDFVWKIPGFYRTELRQGELHTVQRVPWEIVKAVEGNHNLLFDREVIYHMKEDTLAGIQNRGWGISRVLSNFRQAWYVQVLHRFNEAIGMDYVIPMRVICPDPRPGGAGEYQDPAYGMDLGGFASHVNSMLANRRQDPMSWHVCPYPLRYQFMGAEAGAMAAPELLDQGIDQLLNAVGVPVQFYKADLTLQGAQPALRLMESTWSHLTYSLNRFLHWLVSKISEVMSWEEVTARLERPSVADDINRQLARLQLMTSGLISQSTGLKSIGLEFKEEQRKMLDEQTYVADQTQEAQQEMQAKQLASEMAQPVMPAAGGGAPQAGGAPGVPAAPGGASAGQGMQPGMAVDPVEDILASLPMDGQMIDPTELKNSAETIAQKAFGLDRGKRISMLRKLKQRNEAVYAYVKSKIEEMDNSAKQDGLVQAQQQAQAAQSQQITPVAA